MCTKSPPLLDISYVDEHTLYGKRVKFRINMLLLLCLMSRERSQISLLFFSREAPYFTSCCEPLPPTKKKQCVRSRLVGGKPATSQNEPQTDQKNTFVAVIGFRCALACAKERSYPFPPPFPRQVPAQHARQGSALR